MRLLTNPQTVHNLEAMRRKWKKGQISTREYHDFIELTKGSIAYAERVYHFF